MPHPKPIIHHDAQHTEVSTLVEDLIGQALSCRPALRRAMELLDGLRSTPAAREATRLASELRHAAELLEDAARALDLWAEYARVRQESI